MIVPGRRWLVAALLTAVAGCSSGGGSSAGSLTVTVTGLPAGTSAAVTVLGPTGSHTGVVATTTLSGLTPGNYTVQIAAVTIGSASYQPAVASQTLTVQAGATASFTAQYSLVQASLQVVITGLPGGASGSVSVTGPDGFSTSVTQTTTVTSLAPGQYTLTTGPVTPGGVLYIATPASRIVTVAPGAQMVAQFQYSHPESSLTVTIDGVYITQAAQGYDFSVPLVADRPGLLRVFLKGSEANSAIPDVRVRLFTAGVVTNTYLIHAPVPGVPTSIDEADGTKSWNLPLPEHLIQAGVQLLVDVDPSGIVPLATRANLSYPASGTPQALNVIPGTNYNLLFIPVFNTVDLTTGDVNSTNIADFVNSIRLVHPMWTATTALHAPFSFSGGTLMSNDGNFAWQGALQQVEMLRQAEGGTAYYYGVMHPNYTSGIVGYGYIGSRVVPNFRTGVGWDSRGSGGQLGTQAGATYAHELGHNLGLLHAPCGGATSTDPAFPYSGARVGHAGYNVVTGAITAATDFDVMSYCAPSWISDYSYRRLAAYSTSLRASAPPAQRGVIVSGSMRGGRALLNPALEVVAPPVLPVESGPYRIEGRTADGSIAFSLPFAPTAVGDSPFADLAQFVFTVPLADSVQLAQLRLTGPGVDTMIRARAAALRAGASAPAATRLDATRVRVTWNPGDYSMVMIRDASTGEVLALGQGGSAIVRSGGAALAITASDGVNSTRLRLTP